MRLYGSSIEMIGRRAADALLEILPKRSGALCPPGTPTDFRLATPLGETGIRKSVGLQALRPRGRGASLRRRLTAPSSSRRPGTRRGLTGLHGQAVAHPREAVKNRMSASFGIAGWEHLISALTPPQWRRRAT